VNFNGSLYFFQPPLNKIPMFESLSERLAGAFKNLKGEAKITDLNIAATLNEIPCCSSF
jgi:hypothetical protein